MDPSVKGEDGEPGEKDKEDAGKQGDSKGAPQMLAKLVVSGAHLNPTNVLVAF